MNAYLYTPTLLTFPSIKIGSTVVPLYAFGQGDSLAALGQDLINAFSTAPDTFTVERADGRVLTFTKSGNSAFASHFFYGVSTFSGEAIYNTRILRSIKISDFKLGILDGHTIRAVDGTSSWGFSIYEVNDTITFALAGSLSATLTALYGGINIIHATGLNHYFPGTSYFSGNVVSPLCITDDIRLQLNGLALNKTSHGTWYEFDTTALTGFGEDIYLVTGYMISVTTVANGTATTSKDSADADTVVNVTFAPDSGYSVDWDNVTITTVGAATVLIKDTDTTGHFTMPAGDVTINPAFVKSLTAGVQVSGGHGTASISNAHPTEGDTVTITCYPDSGYEVDTVTSFDATISQVATNQYQFTMPNVDVLATVTFKETPFFNITVEATSNGNVSADPTSGYSGTTIQLTVAPDAGYSLKHLYVLAGTDSVPTTKVDDTHYTFTLPSFNVVVRALFTDGDPYSPGGNSDPSTPGGTGSFDDNTTPITPPAIPAVSVQDSGLYTIFSLSQSELNSFTNYLWSDLFSLPTVAKYLNNATEHILSLHILPFSVNAGSSREIKFMGIGTGGTGNVVSNQHQQIDCGTVLLEEYYGSALDYNPWTKIKLYVPYCGEIDLDPDEVMGKDVSLKYTIDILTGDCYANIGVSGTTMYQLSGNCAMRLPVSASNWSTIITGVKSAVSIAAGVGAAAMGAVGAGLTAAGASTIGSAYAGGSSAMDVSTMDAGLALQRAGQAVTERTPQVGSTNSYMATMSQKSSFVHTGVQTGGASFMSVQVPYILIKRPRQALPENYNHYVGYPAHYTRTLGNMSGFTQIVDWNPSSIPCTENERTEIDRLLKEGVIL